MKLLQSRIAAISFITGTIREMNMEKEIKITTTPRKTRIRLIPKRDGIPTICLIQKVDNLIVYINDLKGNETAGIMSVRSMNDVRKFARWYKLLVELSAYRRNPVPI